MTRPDKYDELLRKRFYQASKELIRTCELARWERFKDTTCPYWIGWHYEGCQIQKFGIADWLYWIKEISN